MTLRDGRLVHHHHAGWLAEQSVGRPLVELRADPLVKEPHNDGSRWREYNRRARRDLERALAALLKFALTYRGGAPAGGGGGA